MALLLRAREQVRPGTVAELAGVNDVTIGKIDRPEGDINIELF